MHVKTVLRVVAAGGLVLLAGGVAVAQNAPQPFPLCTGPTAPPDVEAAKASHTIALQRFNLKDWDKAIEFWRQAYTLDCNIHPLLLNMASAYEGKGDWGGAAFALETYLERVPNAADADTIRAKIEDYKKRVVPPKPTATASAAPTVTATQAPTTPPPPPVRPYGNAPLFVAGGGAALAIAGAILVPVGLGPYNTAQAECKNADGTPKKCDPVIADAGNTGRAMWNTGAWLLGAGVLAAAGGLGFHFIVNTPKPASSAPAEDKNAPASGAPASKPVAKAPSAATAFVAPVVAPGFGGVTVVGKF